MPTIALVDDDRNILTSVSLSLEAEGYRVQTYTDGATALSRRWLSFGDAPLDVVEAEFFPLPMSDAPPAAPRSAAAVSAPPTSAPGRPASPRP